MKARFQSLVALIQNNTGKVPVYFKVDIDSGPGAPATVNIRGGGKTNLRPAPELFVGLRKILKPGAIRITGNGTQARKPPEPPWKRREPAQA